MAQTTIRLEPDLKQALVKLSKLRSVTFNKMVTQALEQFVVTESRDLQAELRESLKQIDAIAARDPDYEKGIAAVAAAEAALIDDPVEGTPMMEQEKTTERVRGLLRA